MIDRSCPSGWSSCLCMCVVQCSPCSYFIFFIFSQTSPKYSRIYRDLFLGWGAGGHLSLNVWKMNLKTHGSPCLICQVSSNSASSSLAVQHDVASRLKVGCFFWGGRGGGLRSATLKSARFVKNESVLKASVQKDAVGRRGDLSHFGPFNGRRLVLLLDRQPRKMLGLFRLDQVFASVPGLLMRCAPARLTQSCADAAY